MNRAAVIVVLFLLTGLMAGCGPKDKGAADGKTPDGAAAQSPPDIAKLDFSKGPNGEEVAKVESSERVYFAFQNKSKAKVRHGLYTEFFDKGKTKKKVEGNYFAGQWHGTVTEWYESGEKKAERFYDRGKGVGTHQGFEKPGGVAWSLSFDGDGKPLLTKSSTKAALGQIEFLAGGRFLPKEVKADVSNYWHQIGDKTKTAPPVGQRFVRLFLGNGSATVEFSLIASHLGQPIEMYDTKITGGGAFKTIVFECGDGYVRIGVSNTDWLKRNGAMPFFQPKDTIQLLQNIVVSADRGL
jgi:hypothetical protein